MQKGLGKGLDALIPGILPEIELTKIPKEEIQKIPLEKIKPNRYQARKKFDETKLKELAESIKEKGLLQPLIVSPSIIPGEYELIAGERRYRASYIAGLTEVPAIVRSVTDKEKAQISLIENLQREDLNPIEEAKAYKRIIEEFNITQEELAKLIGKDRSVIANSLRILNLPESVQDMISEGIITSGHARALASIQEEEKIKEISERIQKEKLTVREVEKIVQDWKTTLKKRPAIRKRPPEIVSLENNLQKLLGTKVQVFSRGKKGKIVIYFYSLDDLDRLLKKLGRR
ncbi:MAG: ParB/RepB/Spo0J family partition protein [Endomicrobiia bacterium]